MIILVASEEVLTTWSTVAPAHEVLAVPEDNAGDVPELVRRHHATTVVLEEAFALSEQAAPLITRLQTDLGVEIRLLAPEGVSALRSAGTRRHVQLNPLTFTTPLPHRSIRLRPARPTEILLDGKPVMLVDLSQSGAQVYAAFALRPRQHVRLVLRLVENTPVRVTARIVWSKYEGGASAPAYRVGLKLAAALPCTAEEILPQLPDRETPAGN